MKNCCHCSAPTIYILDAYNPYDRNEDVRLVFRYHEQQWCVREVELEWGEPHFIEQDLDDNFSHFKIYNTFDEALKFVKELQNVERPKI